MPTFEEQLQRLEQLGEELRQGKLPIDDAMTRFEEGIKLAKKLEKDLSKIERRIEILVNEPEKNGEAPSFELFTVPETDDTESK